MKYRICLILLALSTFISSPCYAASVATPSDATPSNAVEIEGNDDDFELINGLESGQYDFDYGSFVDSVDATYTVVVPAKVQLGEASDGTWSAVYKVGVDTLNDNIGISIKPATKVISLKSIGKKDISAHIEQDITEFSSGIHEADGRIWVDDYDLSAGMWTGVLSFDVEVKENRVEIASATPSDAEMSKKGE